MTFTQEMQFGKWLVGILEEGTAKLRVILDSNDARIISPDVTAPLLTSPVGTQTGTTTATVGATTNEANGTFYWFVSTSGTPPSAANLKAGTGSVAFGNQAVTLTGVKSFPVTGLSATTTYYAYFLHRDAAGNDSLIAAASSFITATPDTTAPTLSSATGTSTGTSTGTLHVTTNEANGILYWFVSTSASPPTAANLKAGVGAVSSSNQSVSATGVQTASATGLTDSTVYYTYFLHRDAAGNDSSIASASSFTTNSAAPVNTVAPVISGSLSVGDTLTISLGTWTNSPTSYDHGWFRANDALGTGISYITGGDTYVLQVADVGKYIVADTRAYNASAPSGVNQFAAYVGPIVQELDSFLLIPAASADLLTYPADITVDLSGLDYDITLDDPDIRLDRATAENMTTGLVTGTPTDILSSGPIDLGLASAPTSGTWYFKAYVLISGTVVAESNLVLHGNNTAVTMTSGSTFSVVEQSQGVFTITGDRTSKLDVNGGLDANKVSVQSGYGTSRILYLDAQSVAADTDFEVDIVLTGLNGVETIQSLTLTVTAFDETPTLGVSDFLPSDVPTAVAGSSNAFSYTVAGLGVGVTTTYTSTYAVTKNGSGSATSGTCVNGDVLAGVVTASSTPGAGLTETLTVGTGSDSFIVTTVVSNPIFTSATGTSKHSGITLSNATATATLSTGLYPALQAVRCANAIVPDKFHLELTLGVVPTVPFQSMQLGFDDGTSDYTTVWAPSEPWQPPEPSLDNAKAHDIMIVDTGYYVQGYGLFGNGGFAGPASDDATVGDILIVEGQRSTGSISFWRKRGGTTTGPYTLACGTAFGTTWYPYFAGFCDSTGFSATLNLGASAFVQTPTAGYSAADGS